MTGHDEKSLIFSHPFSRNLSSTEDRGLRSATPELPTRLLASIALSITPDSVKRLTDTHVEFATRRPLERKAEVLLFCGWGRGRLVYTLEISDFDSLKSEKADRLGDGCFPFSNQRCSGFMLVFGGVSLIGDVFPVGNNSECVTIRWQCECDLEFGMNWWNVPPSQKLFFCIRMRTIISESEF